MNIQELESQIARLNRPEKAELLVRLAREVGNDWPGIERSPDVAGGDPCIVRTRIAVWTLEGFRRLGWTEARILESYPALRAADLVNAWAYVDAHREEIDRAIQDNQVG